MFRRASSWLIIARAAASFKAALEWTCRWAGEGLHLTDGDVKVFGFHMSDHDLALRDDKVRCTAFCLLGSFSAVAPRSANNPSKAER